MAGEIMRIKDIMSEEIHYIQVPGNRGNALELMRENNVSGLPVVKKGTKNLVGILTRTDLVENPDEEQIALIMTRDMITVGPEDDIKDAAKKMIHLLREGLNYHLHFQIKAQTHPTGSQFCNDIPLFF